EIELPTKLLAQRQTPGAVDTAAIGRMHDELHAAGLIEEALKDDVLEGGEVAQRRPAGREIFGQLVGGGLGDAYLVGKPAGDLRRRPARGHARNDSCT